VINELLSYIAFPSFTSTIQSTHPHILYIPKSNVNLSFCINKQPVLLSLSALHPISSIKRLILALLVIRVLPQTPLSINVQSCHVFPPAKHSLLPLLLSLLICTCNCYFLCYTSMVRRLKTVNLV